MRKLFLWALFLSSFCVVSVKALPIGDPQQPDVFGIDGQRSGIEVSTYIIRIDYDGNILPGRNEFSDIGSSTETYRRGHFGSINASSGIQNVNDIWTDLDTANTTNYIIGLVSTAAMVSASTGATFVIADFYRQPDYARGLSLRTSFSFLSSTVNLPISATVYGVDAFGKNRVVNYRITFSTQIFYDNTIAWATISSITITGTTAGNRSPCYSVIVKYLG